jgi:lysophospholipase L1-like esterase
LVGILSLAAHSVVAVLAAVVMAAAAPPATIAEKPVRIMALGDSVTDGLTLPDGTPGSFRNDLWQLLKADRRTVDFVGSQASGEQPLGDPDHEGHPDWTIGQLNAKATDWLRTYQPDIILLHAGTDDLAGVSTPQAAIAALSTLVGTIVAARPAAEVFVATLIPSPSDVLNSQIRQFNEAVPGIVARRGNQVHLVDMYSALTGADLADPLHPTGGGYSKMAARWFSALIGAPLNHFEAEDGSLTKGSTVTTTTASGGVKVSALTEPGSSLVLRYNAPKNGDERVYIRTDNGNNAACTQQVWGKDGVPITVTYAGFADWNLWGTAAVTVPVDAGENTLTFAGGRCGAEIDAVNLAPVTTSPYL